MIASKPSYTGYELIDKQTGIQLLETYARRNAYDYKLYRLKEELHLKVPRNCLHKPIIQNKKAQLQDHDSSNEALNQENLSLINFIGDVIFKPKKNHDSASASSIRGFIKTSKEQRIFHYTKTAIDKQAYQSAKSAFDNSVQNSKFKSSGCLGIITIGQTSKITVHNNAINLTDFDLTSEIQFAKSIAPKVQLVNYTGISILSALKTAITDQINRPKLLILNYSCPVFELSKTELQEINYWIDIAKARNILIISSKTESNLDILAKESLAYKLNKTIKADIELNTQLHSHSFPVIYQRKPYLIPLKQLNSIIWALRLLNIVSESKQTNERIISLTSEFLKHTSKTNELQDLILPFINPSNETDYFDWVFTQINKKGGCNV
ncbi:MAG: hypothetical protein U9N51_08010 [Bacteroidota bacterium]|nr:hypothetical protein [Bacteroidota bacterium]